MKVFKKNTKLSLGLIVIIILCCTAILGLIGAVTDGFEDFEFRQINEDNIIKVENYSDSLTAKHEGLTCEVNKDGVIAISGKSKGGTSGEFIVQTNITLEPGEYTLSCDGVKGLDDDTYYLVLSSSNASVILDNDKPETFTVTESTTYTLIIVIEEDVEVNAKFKPVLVKDDEAGSFYVFDNK